jgi:hypothetical protein
MVSHQEHALTQQEGYVNLNSTTMTSHPERVSKERMGPGDRRPRLAAADLGRFPRDALRSASPAALSFKADRADTLRRAS